MLIILSLNLHQILWKFDYTECSATNCPLDDENSNFFGNLNGNTLEAKYNLKATYDYLVTFGFGYQKFLGYTDYVGDYLTNPQGYGTVKSSTKTILTNKNLFVQVANISDDAKVFLSTGIGQREWNRWLSDTQKEIYKWDFAKIGIGYEENIYDDFTLGLELSYQKAINPEMLWVEKNYNFSLGKTDGHNLKIPLRYKLFKNLDLIGSYEYDKWKITKSNTIDSYCEPGSITKNQILSAGVVFKY